MTTEEIIFNRDSHIKELEDKIETIITPLVDILVESIIKRELKYVNKDIIDCNYILNTPNGIYKIKFGFGFGWSINGYSLTSKENRRVTYEWNRNREEDILEELIVQAMEAAKPILDKQPASKKWFNFWKKN